MISPCNLLDCLELFGVSSDQRQQKYVKGRSKMPLRGRRSWLIAGVIALAVAAVSCTSNHTAAPPKVIFDKGTPYADLLVPKFTSSVTDGAVGVAVDAPVTVSVADGVLGSV